MACLPKLKVYISDRFVKFPYEMVTAQPDAGGTPVAGKLTVFVPTFADEKAVNKDPFRGAGFGDVRIIKYVSNYEEDPSIRDGVVVYWNAIVPIKITGLGNTLVFNVVLSDNLYQCGEVVIDTEMTTVRCPLQVDFDKTMVCLKGEYAGDSEEIKKALDPNNKQFLLHFDKDTPMGVKILNTKRYLIVLGNRAERAKFCVYLPHDELATIHKELSWESTRRQLRGGVPTACRVVNRPSYKYIVDAMEIMGVDKDDVSSIHRLVEVFNPLILRYKLVPDVFVELNRLNGIEKHVRLYCKYEGVAITNAGPVPLNMPTRNNKNFTHRPPTPLSESFYRELGTRNAFVHAPTYNYFL